jgi:hypothetical protein
MFTIRKVELIGIQKWNKYTLLLAGLIVISYGVINKAPIGYLSFDGNDIGNSYFYDYIAPFLFSLSFVIALMPYNQSGIINTLFFLSNRKSFPTIIYLSCFYTIWSSLFIFVGAYLFYIDTGSMSKVISLALSFVPNIIFLNSLILCLNMILKNSVQCIIIIASYLLLDYFMNARVFGPFSLGIHSYKTNWSGNTSFILLVSMILFYVGSRAKLWLYTERFRER